MSENEKSRAEMFVDSFHAVQMAAHANSKSKGFHPEGVEKNFGEQIALMHSELSEALEGFRKGDKASEHIPEFSAVEEEFADVIIRIMDCAELRGHRVAEAVLAKHMFNTGREHMHGGKKF